jgi:DNA-binding XRE family transcriptional regulator
MGTHAFPIYKRHEALKTTFEVPRYPSRTFPEKLKKRRLELGLKQLELAELLGVNEHTIVKWEKGYVRPHAKNRQLSEDFIKGRLHRGDLEELEHRCRCHAQVGP